MAKRLSRSKQSPAAATVEAAPRPPAAAAHRRSPRVAYFNRELSWLAFNRRVLEQAEKPDNPLLERVKFLAIFSSNLDEFFEIRVAGLIQQVESGVTEPSIDGLGPREQLRRIHSVVASLLADQQRCWHGQLMPALAEANIHFRSADQLNPSELNWVRTYFREQVYPVLDRKSTRLNSSH